MGTDKTKRIIGWGMSLLVVLVLAVDGATQLFAPTTLAGEMAATGWPMERAPLLGAITLLCALIYLVPATAAIGAILVTAFAGGAISTHARIDDGLTPPVLICVAIAAFAWGGLVLRDERLRALLPFRPDVRA